MSVLDSLLRIFRSRPEEPASQVLLEPRDQSTVESTAKGLLWAMNDLLPWHVPSPIQGNFLFRSEEEMRRVWLQHGGAPDKVPRVDFDQRMVVAMFVDAGQYTEATVIREVVAVDHRIEVRHAKVTRGLTMINPCSVIAVPRADGVAEFRPMA